MTVSVDRTVKLWDTRTGKPLASLDGHAGYLFEIVFSHDGTLGIWGVHLETRTPQAIPRIISARDPWTFSNGRLVPVPAALAATVTLCRTARPSPRPPRQGRDLERRVCDQDCVNDRGTVRPAHRARLRQAPDHDRRQSRLKKTHTVDKPAVVKATAPTMRDRTNNRAARAIMQKCKHHEAYAAAIEDM